MKNYILPVSILIAAVLIAGTIIYTKRVSNTLPNDLNNPTINNNNEDSKVFLEVTDSDIVLGDENAPVTVIEYSDPSCSFCGAASGINKEVMNYLRDNDPSWTPPLPGIIDNYVKNGDVKLIFRYFPGQGTAEVATKAMFCVNEQGKFWEIHDLVFGLFENSDSVGLSDVRLLAEGLEIDMDDFDTCVAEDKYAAKLVEDTNSGRALGVNGTPGFLVNGILLEGAYSFSQFEILINDMLGR